MVNKTRVFSFFLVIYFLIALPFFAQNTISLYTVNNKTGNVVYKNDKGFWIEVEVGQRLKLETEIKVSLNSSLTISDNKESYTISQLKKGFLSSLIGVTSIITKGNSAKQVDVDIEYTKNKMGISTASTRADNVRMKLNGKSNFFS